MCKQTINVFFLHYDIILKDKTLYAASLTSDSDI